MKKLSPRQELFIQEYCIDKNGTQAAIRAGYSKKTANEQAARLLANVSIRQEIDAKLKRLEIKLELRAEDILRDIKEMGDEARADGDISNAIRSRELLGKHLKLFTEKVEMSVSDASFDEMSAADKAKFLIENSKKD